MRECEKSSALSESPLSGMEAERGSWGGHLSWCFRTKHGKRLAGLAARAGAGGVNPRGPVSSGAACNFQGPRSGQGATIQDVARRRRWVRT